MRKTLFLIPNYNHPNTIRSVVESCLSFKCDILVVDDGSNRETKAKIAQVCKISNRVNVLTLPVNSGKGGAVLAGFQWALDRQYTHVFQLDADGQQDSGAIPGFLDASIKNPHALICGYPIYDESVPLSRKWGRRITNFWVIVNTLSRTYRDCLCGFRIYPMESICQWISKHPTIGKRMDFDCDILVQLCWQGTPCVNLPVRIFYPADGISHFRPIENWYIAKMHTRNFFGMLVRLPKLLGRHFHA